MKEKGKIQGMIGLEIHVYLVTKEKLFCNCKASREKGQRKNIYVCPICVGSPGAKPMLPNKEALTQGVRIGLMLGCKINKELVWQRKHYDWPDLPKGYQTTLSGGVPGVGENGEFRGIGIWSMHLEEDPAAWDPGTGCVDYNRSGLPLVEIVTAPDFKSSIEVMAWLKKLVHGLSYLKAVDSNAGIKVDVNVNIRDKTQRVEIKNLSSIESIGKAIEYELERQNEEGGVKETRRFDASKGRTFRMRSKEGEDDYRFISDPDLQEIIIESGFISRLNRELPENPVEKLEKIIKKFRIGKKDAEVLTKHIDIAEFFEEVVSLGKGKFTADFALPWITVELLRHLNYNKTRLDGIDIKAPDFVELLEVVRNGKISVLKGKEILNRFYPKSFSIKGEVRKAGKIVGKGELLKVVDRVVKENSKAVEDYNAGDKKALNFLMGKIMTLTEKRADFKTVREILLKILKK
jgi:aspartyl-tRNA(Asn)/glutamyl-tRNA(Gln) amidotransferase subunit B